MARLFMKLEGSGTRRQGHGPLSSSLSPSSRRLGWGTAVRQIRSRLSSTLSPHHLPASQAQGSCLVKSSLLDQELPECGSFCQGFLEMPPSYFKRFTFTKDLYVEPQTCKNCVGFFFNLP